MRGVDRLVEHCARGVARRTSRRGALAKLAGLLLGASGPLLPVDRTFAARPGVGTDAPPRQVAQDERPHERPRREQDPQSCDYWRYCAINGWLCSCCGGSVNSCPPGTTPSPITWVGTCRNPSDGQNYIVAYHDCCGKTSCGQCGCARHEGEKPLYKMSLNNDFNWCAGADNANYHCSTSVVLGVAVS